MKKRILSFLFCFVLFTGSSFGSGFVGSNFDPANPGAIGGTTPGEGNFTNGEFSGNVVIGNPLPVSSGGTGTASVTANGPIVGGTTTTGALVSVAPGNAGQVLTSAGAGAPPTYQNPPAGTIPNGGAVGDILSWTGAAWSSGTGPSTWGMADEFWQDRPAGTVHNTSSTAKYPWLSRTRTVIDTYASTNLTPNPGFETVTAAGPPADFGSWQELVGDGNLEVAIGAGEFRSGTKALKLTAGPTFNTRIYVDHTVISGMRYTFTIYTRGDSTNAGRYKIVDQTNSRDIVPVTSTGVTGTGYQAVTVTVTAPPACIRIGLYLYPPAVNGGIAYFDDVSCLPTKGLLSISGGKLNLAGYVTNGNPSMWYPSVARTAGRLLVSDFVPQNSSASYRIGFHTAPSGAITYNEIVTIGSSLAAGLSGSAHLCGILTFDSSYKVAVVLRSKGVFYFVKGGTQYPSWSLVQVDASDTTAILYPCLQIMSGAPVSPMGSDYLRIPSQLWLPAPSVSDGFSGTDAALLSSRTTDGLGHAEGVAGGIGAGGSGGIWVGNSASILSNKAIITPTQTAEEQADPTFDDPTNWVTPDGWSVANGVATRSSPTVLAVLYNSTTPLSVVGNWYRVGATVTPTAGGYTLGDGSGDWYTSSGAVFRTIRADTTNRMGITAQSSFTGTVDDITSKQLTLSSLFSSVAVSTPNIIASADLTRVAGTQVGLVVNLDSTSSPANFIIAYLDGAGNAKLEKCVDGTYTSLISAAVTYVADAKLVVIKDGQSYDLYYNNAKVGTTATVADAGIISNTKHGLFSTYEQNTFDNFVVRARGTEGQYAVLDEIGGAN